MFRNVGLIGCGTIGSELALVIDSGKIKKAALVSLYDEVENVVVELKSKLQNDLTSLILLTMEILINQNLLRLISCFPSVLIGEIGGNTS